MVSNKLNSQPLLVGDEEKTIASKPLLISVMDACKLLSISRATFFSLRSAGRIGVAEIKIGKKILLRQSEIVDWVAAGCPPRRLWQWKVGAGRC